MRKGAVPFFGCVHWLPFKDEKGCRTEEAKGGCGIEGAKGRPGTEEVEGDHRMERAKGGCGMEGAVWPEDILLSMMEA